MPEYQISIRSAVSEYDRRNCHNINGACMRRVARRKRQQIAWMGPIWRFRMSPLQRQSTIVRLYDVAWRVVRGGRSERTCAHNVHTGTVWHRCACGCASSARQNVQSAIGNWRNDNDMASHLQRTRHVLSNSQPL